ncbi:MAG: DUF4190 domain-containing protein [Candidatus Omnitrophica bacterium]|nr:DUF4190 domain-containing protein [Candidatus Omnitrophota bacterium]
MSELPKQKTHGLAIASLVLGCLILIPLIGMIFSLLAIVFGIIALVAISKNKEVYKGGGLAITGLVLGVVGIVIIPVMLGLVAAIAIPNFLRARATANEAGAQASIRTISTAAMLYREQNGRYPNDDSDLAYANPPYLSGSYNDKTLYGYKYSVKFSPQNYTITAEPENCITTGTKIFTIKDGEFSESRCE